MIVFAERGSVTNRALTRAGTAAERHAGAKTRGSDHPEV
jgi:hypothetical protein